MQNIFKFPDLSDYDLSKVGDIALYHAHTDFFAIKGLIDTSYSTVNSISSLLTSQLTSSLDDIEVFCSTQQELAVYNYRVVPMLSSSILLIMISMLEEAIFCLCRTYHLMHNYEYTVDAFPCNKRIQGIDRYIYYLESIVGLKNIKNDSSWENIKIARRVRNLFVHNGGRFKRWHIEHIEEYEKYGFYKDENSNNILFDDITIKNLYSNIMIFLENTFKKEIDR